MRSSVGDDCTVTLDEVYPQGPNRLFGYVVPEVGQGPHRAIAPSDHGISRAEKAHLGAYASARVVEGCRRL